MCRRILCCVLRQPSIDNISINMAAYINDIIIFTWYFFSLSFAGFFPTMSLYFCSSGIIRMNHVFSLLFYIIFPFSSDSSLIDRFMCAYLLDSYPSEISCNQDLISVPKILVSVPKILVSVPKILVSVPKILVSVPKILAKILGTDMLTDLEKSKHKIIIFSCTQDLDSQGNLPRCGSAFESELCASCSP
jgi:hypothetical protein